MCLVAFAFRQHPEFDLVLIANRDEFYDRPSEPAHFWKDTPDLLAGRDLQAGGTWMGVARDGRFALITNYRDPSRHRANTKSRGLLVSDFLRGHLDARTYLEELAPRAGEYNDFNLLAGSRQGIHYFSSLEKEVREIGPGLYGMSNHLLETPWPKVMRARAKLDRVLHESRGELATEALFSILADDAPGADSELPNTGIGIERERALSSIFIRTKGYGTRCSTVLAIRSDGSADFSERTFPTRLHEAEQTVAFHLNRA